LVSKIVFAILAAVPLSSALASDHESVLDARQDGSIAAFSEILAAARSAVRGQTVLVDARVQRRRSDVHVKVYLRTLGSGEVVEVTVDAVEADVISIVDRHSSSERNGRERPPAKSRPNAESKSKKGSDADRNSESGKSERGNDGRGNRDGKNGGGKGGGGKGGSKK